MKKNLYTLIICFLCHTFVTIAQNAPVTTAAIVVNAVPGQLVTVPVTVTGFNSIGSVTLHLNYDYSKLHFIQCNLNPLLVNNFSVGDINLGNGSHQVAFGWYTNTSATLPDGSWLLNFVFSYITGNSSLQWADNGPSCLYTDADGNTLNDMPTPSFYFNGMVCGVQGSPGPITGSGSVCREQTSVSYSIAPLQNVTNYTWSVPPGSSIASGDSTNSITVDYSSSAVSGSVVVNGVNECGEGPASSLAVAVHNLPVANAGNDTTIAYGTSAVLHAANGGNGIFSYHWSPENMFIDPNVQNPQTVQLTSSNLFHLEVTGLPSLCMSTDDMTVTISGGPLSINPVAVPGTICRYTNSQLFSNAGGGSGNFSYFWTSIPPGNPLWTSNLSDPVVSPDASTQYNLIVSDGFNTTSGSANLIVNQLPTAVISGGGSLCEDGSLAIIRIDLTGIPPWSFIYSNGLTSVTIDGQFTTPYFIMTNVPGVYTVPSINDLNCFGTTSGTASVLLFPVPDKPTITQSGDTLISNASMGNQWYRNLVLIPGATDQDYIPTENGDYYDIVTLNNCSSDSSNTISVLYTNADNGRLNSFQVFPNPAKNYLMIRSSSFFQENMKLTIFSTDGLLIREYQVKMSEGSTEYRIDTSKLSPGLYILMISGGDRRIIERVIVF